MDIQKELEKLNSDQKRAVTDESRALMINANVGSGKTTVLISKLLYLHYVKNVPYEEMVVLTFTNKAAAEIRERLMMYEPELDSRQLRYFGTFHSLAMLLLREELPVAKLGYGTDFQVITPEEQQEMALSLIHEHKLNIKYKNRLKKRLEQEQTSKYGDDLNILKAMIDEEKKKHNKMSFDDLIIHASKLLSEHPVNVRWVIIDEVQDSDALQLQMIRKLVLEETSLFALGDPNQVIYSWRGSSLNVFFKLKEEYFARELSLPVNYRSNTAILKAAGYFKQSGQELVGQREYGRPVKVREMYDAFQDAGYIAERIKKLHEEGMAYHEIAVFYRLQNQSSVFENVFAREGIPFSVSVRRTLQDIPVLCWLIHVLRYALDSEDRASGLYILMDKHYGRGLTAKKAEKLLNEPDFFIEKIRCFTDTYQEGIPSAEEMYAQFEIDEHIHPVASTYSEDKKDVMQFLRSIQRDMLDLHKNFRESLVHVLSSVALFGIHYARELYEESDGVRLMTLHASKGLEFKAVFITGVNNGLIPLQGNSEGDEDEERRLFFVGMTRAKDYLELSYYTNPDQRGAKPGIGKFIKSIPPKYISSEDRAKGMENLQDIKRLVLEEIKKSEIQEETQREPVRIKVDKYGIGVLISEDDMMIRAEFEGYGEKEFIKAFTSFEYIGNLS